MDTKTILEKIKEEQFSGVRIWEDFKFMTDEIHKDLKEVASEYTNPRRDYVGTKYFIKNNFDEKFFFIEIYGNDMSREVYAFGEVVPEEKTVTIYREVK